MLIAWFCKKCQERRELNIKDKYCPECGTKMQRCSRYEWFLYDAMFDLLFDQWEKGGRIFNLEAQYPIYDHRGFYWYFDLYIWIEGESYFNGYGELIEINGFNHNCQSKYKGPGGGYTRDYDKHWEVFNNYRLHKKGIEYRVLSNEECNKRNVKETARKIINEVIARADRWC